MPSAGSLVHLNDLRLVLDGPGGPVNILKGINLEIAGGEIVSVVGPSGSGKTSLLMVVAGLEPASGGTILIDGQDLSTLDEDGLALFRRNRIGIVFQSFHLVPTMSALENVALPLEFAGVEGAFDRAAAILERVGLGHRLKHYPGQLSGGEQQRVGLARAIAPEPALLLADEPTGNLDGQTGKLVADLLFELAAEQGTGLMLITHDTQLAARCDRQVEMREGLLL